MNKILSRLIEVSFAIFVAGLWALLIALSVLVL
jgi:hypothetical protein